MDTVDRIILAIEQEGLSRRELEQLTGVKTKRWENICGRLAKPYALEIEALSNLWPEYTCWLASGREIPEAGQISPMTKKAHEASKTPQKAG